MGCSWFHMSRDEPKKFKQYRALKIAAPLEQLWTTEAFMNIYNKVLNEQYQETLWRCHSYCAEYAQILKSEDYYIKILNLTRFVAPKEVDGNKIIIAETINGRRDNKFRDGLIYGSYDSGMTDEAKEFAKIALWLADNDKEPIPNENFWSIERVDRSKRKTEEILKKLKLNP